jgi:hypothetical protein
MLKQSGFVQVGDLDIKFGVWKYTGGTVRFSGGKIFVPAVGQKEVDKRKKR